MDKNSPRVFPGNADELRELVNTVPRDKLTWLYQSADLLKAFVNERWSIQEPPQQPGS